MISRPPTGNDPSWLSSDGPTLLGIINLNVDSFSDPRDNPLDEITLERASQMVSEGAVAVDLGAQSGALAAAEVPPQVQAEMLAAGVARLTDAAIAVSIDAYHPLPVERGLAAGAAIVNDYSGLARDEVLGLTARAGAWYVLTHNPVGPRARQRDPDYYQDVVGHVVDFWESEMPRLESAGLSRDRVMLDPGIDLGKTPAQSLELVRGLDRLRGEVDCPIFLAPSRKDVIGVISGARPADRDPGTLAILGSVVDHPRTLVRIHNVAAARQYLEVARAIRGFGGIRADQFLADELRRQS